MPGTPWVIDLDGVIWTGERPVRGSARAVAALRSRDHPVWFCTNNSSWTEASVVARLAEMGIAADGCVLTSARAVGSLVERGARVLCCSGPGVVDAVRAAGGIVIDPGVPEPGDDAVDMVVVGFHRDVSYGILRRATRAVLAGARLVATNDDPVYPDTDGPSPGCGAILAAVERATGARATVAGKPHGPMVDLVRSVAGHGPGVVVGDSPSTDGGLAGSLGWSFGLVTSGNTAPSAVPTSVDPDWVGADLAELVDRLA